LRTGDVVWTSDSNGHRVSAALVAVSRVSVGPNHEMSHVVLGDGRQVLVSPGHPTCKRGETVGALRAGTLHDEAIIRSIERVPYAEPETFDILPAGETGCYWANGVLLGSTLK
jgi:hypothetical protein